MSLVYQLRRIGASPSGCQQQFSMQTISVASKGGGGGLDIRAAAVYKTVGCNNALTLFGITQIPSDNQVRNLLDPVPPSAVLPVFAAVVDALRAGGQLEAYRTINGDVLVSMDGTLYFSSSKIHCPQCRVSEHHNGTVTYSHSVVTPVIVAPGKARVIPLEPEFITPQDGHAKQDCENAAAKRWLAQFGTRYAGLGATILGDDLYCKQPLGVAILREGLNFILVCKPDSHKTLDEWVAGLAASGDVHTRTITRREGPRRYTDMYRFVSDLPLRDGDDALLVNWCELTTTRDDGKVVYHNAFATNHAIDADTVAEIVRALTRYLGFESWTALMAFMIRGLELPPPDTS
jgi:hypothetical protein